MMVMRGVALMSLALLGCSTMRPATPPPTGLMWAYRAESEVIPSLRIVAYAADRATCEVNRAKDMKMPATAAWSGVKVAGECRQVAVGAGADFWVFTIGALGTALGATDRDWCVKLRQGAGNTYGGSLGDCGPVAIKNLQ